MPDSPGDRHELATTAVKPLAGAWLAAVKPCVSAPACVS